MYPSRTIPGSILIVEDELAFRETLETFLRKRGYRVASSVNSNEALERITQEPFDLILADAPAAGRSGLQLLEHQEAGRGRRSWDMSALYHRSEVERCVR